MAVKRKWWEMDQFDQGIEAVLADKRGTSTAPPLINPTSPNPVLSPGSNPRITPTRSNAEIRVSPDGSPEALVENRRGTTFTAQKISPFSVPNGPAPLQAPALTPDPDYDAAQQKYAAEMKRGPQKQGVASQVLFQIAEGMANFGRGMQGQPMKDFQWLGEAKDERRNAQAAREFAPHEALRQQRIQGAQQQAQIQKAQYDAAAAHAKSIRESNPVLAQQIEEMIKNGQPIPKEIADQLPGAGLGVAIPGQDTRKREYREAEGKTWSRPIGSQDPNEWQEEKPLQKRNEQLIERELDDGSGTKFFTTGDDEADRIATKSRADADYALKVGEINQRELDEHNKRLEAWQKDNQGVQEKKTQLLGDAQTHETDAAAKREQGHAKSIRANQLQEENPNMAASLRDEADKLEVEARNHDAKARAARTKADSIKATPPPKFNKKKVTTPELSTGTQRPTLTVSRSQLEKLSKQTGKSVDELREMAEKEGYRIQ